ncbi:MAG: SAM-dependent methyltransferase [Rhodovulum sulfidophilum]|uniref:SAM-dependent methyltransferase n=1 Tax=Rhodovulum sulfidophilum TaxID=35806 RepID=A0A2W5NHS1_RHOSU|nr:MAG: SAM-dependent methyltransferase [Rhodovulum sulfidophilum]
MSAPPALFDPALLAQRRARADARGAPADFLREIAAAEIAERLSEVNRRFQAPVVIGPRGALFAEAIGLPGARLLPDAETLDLAEGEADLVVHALALHWANDPVGQIAQARRALRPDGLFIAALFAGDTLWELRQALAAAETEILGGLSPRVAPMGEIRDLGGLLQRAGLALPVADSARQAVSYQTMFHLIRDLRAMAETNVLADRTRRPATRALFARAAEIYAERFDDGVGRVGATFEIVYLTGWAPAPNQQKPLRPGSAAARLADALGAEEIGAGERAGKPG